MRCGFRHSSVVRRPSSVVRRHSSVVGRRSLFVIRSLCFVFGCYERVQGDGGDGDAAALGGLVGINYAGFVQVLHPAGICGDLYFPLTRVTAGASTYGLDLPQAQLVYGRLQQLEGVGDRLDCGDLPLWSHIFGQAGGQIAHIGAHIDHPVARFYHRPDD